MTLNNALNQLESEVSGKATGPVSSTDKVIVRFSGNSGSLIQDSNVTVDNSGNVTTPGGVTATGTVVAGGLTSANKATVAGDIAVMGTVKGYRLRADGSNLNFEGTGTGLIVFNWSGTNFN
ncbi:hypothetical protein [Streptomyces sp. CA-106110]|uniref:hypothetical protein n=1 Tax=Streptomyces sp. CA-106110 TaxID=3240044 RepID=UPI003D902F3C